LTARSPRDGGTRYRSPLRYPGGKARLADFVKTIFRANHLLDGTYAEPYAGGASVALTLLFEEYASTIHINDIDTAVHAFWDSVLNRTDELCRLVRDTRATSAEWLRQKQIYSCAEDASPLQLGFAAFFLNRTNRSGIIGSAGMIGGRKQRGRWKIDARYNRPELSRRIARIARYGDRIHLTKLDAADFLKRADKGLPAKTLVYLDPPYYIKGQRRLYANYYGADDHANIATLLSTVRLRWLVSYDNTPEIRRLYRAYQGLTYTLRYTASESQSGSEVMYFAPTVSMPAEYRSTLERPRRLARRCPEASTNATQRATQER
jgi:DNA adenine methylase